jgi:hypothetical protein
MQAELATERANRQQSEQDQDRAIVARQEAVERLRVVKVTRFQ